MSVKHFLRLETKLIDERGGFYRLRRMMKRFAPRNIRLSDADHPSAHISRVKIGNF
jgi:hypothetical protein